LDIIAEIVSALTQGEQAVLATIVGSSGSTPLPAGAALLLRRGGETVVGTVGGGSLEASVIDEATQMLGQGSGALMRGFELSENAPDGSMICGGNVEVLIEMIPKEDLLLFSKLRDLRDAGVGCTLLRMVSSGAKTVDRIVLEGTSERIDAQLLQKLSRDFGIHPEGFVQDLRQAHRQEAIKRVPARRGELIIQPIIGLQPLIIFGGGHIAKYLSRIATTAGFSVTVIDDRAEYANAARFPEASRTLAVKFDEAFGHLDVKPSTSIVIVTRGHATDAGVLRRAVCTSARYVGMIGSSKKVISTYAQLKEQGVPISLLKRVAAPIGLDIGAVSAEEIAVSIVAELIQVRRGKRGAPAAMSDRVKEWFDRVEGKGDDHRGSTE